MTGGTVDRFDTQRNQCVAVVAGQGGNIAFYL